MEHEDDNSHSIRSSVSKQNGTHVNLARLSSGGAFKWDDLVFRTFPRACPGLITTLINPYGMLSRNHCFITGED